MKKLFYVPLLALTFLCTTLQAQPVVKSVGTITQLLTINPSDISTNYFLPCLSTSGDGLGGLFTYFAGNTTATNTASIFKPINYSGRWIRADFSTSGTNGPNVWGSGTAGFIPVLTATNALGNSYLRQASNFIVPATNNVTSLGSSTNYFSDVVANFVNSIAGFKFNSTATNGTLNVGNGTNYVPAANTTIFVDTANARLGIGTNAPTGDFEIFVGTDNSEPRIDLRGGSGSGIKNARINFISNAGGSTTNASIIVERSGANDASIFYIQTKATTLAPVTAFSIGNNQLVTLTKGMAMATTTPGAYPYNILASDNFVFVDSTGGARSIVLPTPVGCTGQTFTVKDDTGSATTNNITVSTSAGTIDGAATDVLLLNWTNRTYISNGTNWRTY